MRLRCAARSALLVVGICVFASVGSCDGVDRRAVVLFQCGSPSGRLKAVYWVRSGGGAAGWVQQILTIVPAGDDSSALGERTRAETLLNAATFAHAPDSISLAWTGDERLAVGFGEGALIVEATPGLAYTRLTPNLRITYRSIPVDAGGKIAGGSTCTNDR